MSSSIEEDSQAIKDLDDWISGLDSDSRKLGGPTDAQPQCVS